MRNMDVIIAIWGKRIHFERFGGFFHAVTFLSVFLVLAGCQRESQKTVKAVRGEAAPVFTLPNVKGEPVSLSSAGGKVVLVEFWATWCPPCRESLPAMNKLFGKYEQKGLAVFAVAVQDKPEGVKGFVESEGLGFPVLMDDGAVSKVYGVRGIPALFFINRKGVIVFELEGYRPSVDREIEEKVKELLGEDG